MVGMSALEPAAGTSIGKIGDGPRAGFVGADFMAVAVGGWAPQDSRLESQFCPVCLGHTASPASVNSILPADPFDLSRFFDLSLIAGLVSDTHTTRAAPSAAHPKHRRKTEPALS
jgi:hypothetical protein